MADFVLVHGAWQGGWCWELLTAELTARGHTTRAPDLPGDYPSAGVAEYAASLPASEGSIVVGHSLGGMTIPLVPALRHVFVAALVPSPGESLPGDALFPEFGGTVRDELDRSYWPDAGAAGVLFDGLSEEVAAWAFPRLRPQGRPPTVEPSPVTALPRDTAYLVCTRDRVIRPEWQVDVARRLLGVEPVAIDAGHFPMLECPVELADVLETVAASPV
jgi:pimeloyl-ACP methyl ester carboxylesterase